MEMWGDAEGAYSLKPSDKLATCLFQITGPAHVPYQDDRWQQLLLHYNQLVHLHYLGFSQGGDDATSNGNDGHAPFHLDEDVVGNACRQCAKYSPTSSNLAALSLHVARMIRGLQLSFVELKDIYSTELSNAENASKGPGDDDGIGATTQKSSGTNGSAHKSFIKHRIALIGKARVTCGALNLLRILCHETILDACCHTSSAENVEGASGGTSYYPNNHQSSPLENDTNYILKESFTYRSRMGDGANSADREIDGKDAALELLSSLMTFLSTLGLFFQQQCGSLTSQNKPLDILSIPEMYDVVVQILSLQLVLLSTQLYDPFESSAQLSDEGRVSNHYFLNKWMEYSFWQRQNSRQHQKDSEERLRQNLHGQNLHGQNLGNENMGMEEYPIHVQHESTQSTSLHNESLLFLMSCLHWLIDRPSPPKRSIASHYVELTKSVAQQVTGLTIAPDGMYESHSVVMARVPTGDSTGASSNDASSVRTTMPPSSSSIVADISPPDGELHTSTAISLGTDDAVTLSSPGHLSGDPTYWNKPRRLLTHPIRSILFLSSSFLLLPVRIVRLVIRLMGHSRYRALLGGRSSFNSKDFSDHDHTTLQKLQKYCDENTGWNKTNNILWLTDSPIADLGCALFLLLSNNCRVHTPSREGSGRSNPFRAELASLDDNRWEQDTLSKQFTTDKYLPSSLSSSSEADVYQQLVRPKHAPIPVLSINFESLFEAFGSILHTENGALMLYTLLLSSPIFAASLAARSDLDTLIMPLLRTLYFSSRMIHEHIAPASSRSLRNSMPSSEGSTSRSHNSPCTALSPQNRPFRSQSQLYVILILLLIFSQDQSFGRVSFRLLSIPNVKWYKERTIKNVSLGSMILLVLLRAITFNLNKLRDEFLLSNCCAVLLNLSPHIISVHEYAATRLVSVTTSCFKRYSTLVVENGNKKEAEGELSTSLGMHGETCRTLLQLIKHCIRPKCLDKNMYLVYSLLVEQRDFLRLCESTLFAPGEMDQIAALIGKANDIIQESGNMMSAEETMEVLNVHSVDLKSYSIPDGVSRARADSADSHASDASDLGNLTFTYEEEEDPEIFFVPYVWDVIVCSLTSATSEWNRGKVQVFCLNDEMETSADDEMSALGSECVPLTTSHEVNGTSGNSQKNYGVNSQDVV